LELLGFGSVSVICGALEALAIDQMIPDSESIKRILEICRDIHKYKDKNVHESGLTDSRKYLAIACANWDKRLTEDFLNHCIETSKHIDKFNKEVSDENLAEVCKNSLKGKYSKAYLSY
jgi:hypothetical protein